MEHTITYRTWKMLSYHLQGLYRTGPNGELLVRVWDEGAAKTVRFTDQGTEDVDPPLYQFMRLVDNPTVQKYSAIFEVIALIDGLGKSRSPHVLADEDHVSQNLLKLLGELYGRLSR